jgi:alkylated DNA repair dioxygenase AlkB
MTHAERTRISLEPISIPGAEIYYHEHFLSLEESTRMLAVLLRECAWERRRTAFGPPVPRDEAYYGDPGTRYTYSRREYAPLPWIQPLLMLKLRIEEATPDSAYANLCLPRQGYNAVLCNLYRNGDDSVGLHADNEPEMGPIIASLSLGAERLFRLKRRDGSVALRQTLPGGSLLIMAGDTQKNFKHEVPKDREVREPRINLTFRFIQHQ